MTVSGISGSVAAVGISSSAHTLYVFGTCNGTAGTYHMLPYPEEEVLRSRFDRSASSSYIARTRTQTNYTPFPSVSCVALECLLPQAAWLCPLQVTNTAAVAVAVAAAVTADRPSKHMGTTMVGALFASSEQLTTNVSIQEHNNCHFL